MFQTLFFLLSYGALERLCFVIVSFPGYLHVCFALYFTASGWSMALSDPGNMIPVRFEIKGSQNYNVSNANVTYFHVIGDFIDFIPKPTFQQTQLQVSSEFDKYHFIIFDYTI